MTSTMPVIGKDARSSQVEPNTPVLRCKIENGRFKCISCNVSMESYKSFSYHLWKHLHDVDDLNCKWCEKFNIDPKTVTEENVQCDTILSTIEQLKLKKEEERILLLDGQNCDESKQMDYTILRKMLDVNNKANSISESRFGADEIDSPLQFTPPQLEESEVSRLETKLSYPSIDDSQRVTDDETETMSDEDNNLLLDTTETSADEIEESYCDNINDNSKGEDPKGANKLSDLPPVQNDSINTSVKPLEFIKAMAMNFPSSDEIAELNISDHVASESQTDIAPLSVFKDSPITNNRISNIGKLRDENLNLSDRDNSSVKSSSIAISEKMNNATSDLQSEMKCSYVAGKYVCETCNISKSFHRAFAYHAWKHVHILRLT
ncbi:uncharacterized protein LOC141899047 [Tubulanus polymorphus]|uniref:uncharacterized protein LOC141899047 n=1 Tax=Tubulanus polymorphus TaxID=672921 RepID=UPI003DA4470D